MFVQVTLLTGFKKPLFYKVPESWEHKDLVGAIVQVPIRNYVTLALVLKQFSQQPLNIPFTIKQITSLELFPSDCMYQQFITQLSDYYQIKPIHFFKRIRQFLEQEESHHLENRKIKESDNITSVILTDEQQKVTTFLRTYLRQPVYKPTILHGVTGSGKTEIYKQLIIATFELNKTTVLLLPEVTLAQQFETILKQQLPASLPIYGFHSATTAKQKRIAWQSLVQKKPLLLIGVHLPILLPISNLGLIIVDEEHETGYQEKKHPKINSKEAAIWRAKINNIPIILGSATPSLHSLYNVKIKGWHFFQLKKRFSGAFPKIKTVILTENRRRPHFWISSELKHALQERLNKKEQAIIFLNRRGFSFFVQCKMCSFIFSCNACSVSLTLHKNNELTCHYCGFSMQKPLCCPTCHADEKKLLKKGIGTQQIVSILEKMFPTATIGRADLDITRKKKLWKQTLDDFQCGNTDILVGTQTITKGFHFPHVTLVGIIWADASLHFPVYNAAETTLQQLIQVAGRAGRQQKQSTVIVQTMVNHRIFEYMNETDYLTFYHDEIKHRKELDYPPYNRLAEIELKYHDEVILENEAQLITHHLLNFCKNKQIAIQILGPAKPLVYTIQHIHMRKIYLKGKSFNEISALYKHINTEQYKSSVFFTPNALH